jgi:hypothetical protein
MDTSVVVNGKIAGTNENLSTKRPLVANCRDYYKALLSLSAKVAYDPSMNPTYLNVESRLLRYLSASSNITKPERETIPLARVLFRPLYRDSLLALI